MRSARRLPPSRARARLRPRRSVAPRPHRRRRPLLRRPRPRHHPPPRFPRSPQPLPRPRRPRSARRLRRRPRRIPDGRLSAVISVVVPVHNEERSVALLYDELRSALEPLQTPWETIFVDDGSTDGTFGALTRLHNAEENVRVVRLRRNFGKAAALVPGFDQARGETVVTIDGDLLTVSFIGRYGHRPLHLFGGLGLILGFVGSAILVYLTVLKALGHAIGHRPLLMLGVLLLVIGMQFFSLGLISEMITSHHEERAQERERAELLVDEILS